MKNIIYSTPIIMIRTLWTFLDTFTRYWWFKILGKETRRNTDLIIRRWAKKTLDIVNVKLIIEGNPPIYQAHQPYIIMSNHSSLYDIPIIFSSLPGSIRMIAKKELSQIPYFGASLKSSEFIFIDRNNRTQAISDLKRAKEKMMDGIVIWAAPEGTRSRTGELGTFKKGIFKLAKETNAIVVPVHITGAYQLLKPKTWHFNPGQLIHVNIGKPIYANEWDENTLSQKIRETMLR